MKLLEKRTLYKDTWAEIYQTKDGEYHAMIVQDSGFDPDFMNGQVLCDKFAKRLSTIEKFIQDRIK